MGSWDRMNVAWLNPSEVANQASRSSVHTPSTKSFARWVDIVLVSAGCPGLTISISPSPFSLVR